MPEIGFDLSAVAARRSDVAGWPEGAVALWFIFGQSNADGYAPRAQDPARADAAEAVSALSPEEIARHPWIRFSTRGAGPDSGRFTASQGLATDAAPRTASKVWTAGPHGIPAGEPSFGPEIGLIRHVLSGAAPGDWRDDAAPRLRVFKQTEGGRSVDHFRWGGPGRDLILDALRRTGAGETLTSLAEAGPVLIQGMIFVIGERDSTDPRPDGSGTMAESLAPRFAEWVRQLRAALGGEIPALFVEIHDALDARKTVANQQLAALAGSIPAAAVLPRQPDWAHVGDGVHYDAVAQDRIGAAAFAHFRDGHGRPSDGLVTAHPFTGLKPWFHVRPLFTDDLGDRMRIAATSAVQGTLHAMVVPEGAPSPTTAEILAAGAGPGGFSRAMSADSDQHWFTPAGSFVPNTTQDVHVVLEGADGVLGERAVLRRSAHARFGPDLAASAGASGELVWSARPTFAGRLSWVLHDGARGILRPEDVEAEAFLPVRSGALDCAANEDVGESVSGLTPGATYTLTLTGRRTSDDARAVTQQAIVAAG
jgi:hypothetical protein